MRVEGGPDICSYVRRAGEISKKAKVGSWWDLGANFVALIKTFFFVGSELADIFPESTSPMPPCHNHFDVDFGTRQSLVQHRIFDPFSDVKNRNQGGKQRK